MEHGAEKLEKEDQEHEKGKAKEDHAHHHHGHRPHRKSSSSKSSKHVAHAPLAGQAAVEQVHGTSRIVVFSQIPPLRIEIVTPTWNDVKNILLRLGACMKGGPGGCMEGQPDIGLDFSKEQVVIDAWDIIMDAAIPNDGRRQLVHEETTTGAFWMLRNEAAAMPINPNFQDKPDYGQFTDAELRTLNNWGESKHLHSYRSAINVLHHYSSCAGGTVLMTCGAVGPGGVIAPGSRSSKLVRYDVDVVWNNELFRAQILDAFRVLQDPKMFPRVNQNSPAFDLGEWGDHAAIHGGPWQIYRSEAGGHGMWCWHRVFQFLPWHRPWLAAVEGALAEAQVRLGYANPIGLPYWDQTKPYLDAHGKESYRNGHPIFFTEEYESYLMGPDPSDPTKSKKLVFKNPLHPKNAKSLFKIGDQDETDGHSIGDDGVPILDGSFRKVIRGWPEEMMNTSDNNQMCLRAHFVKEGKKDWDDIVDTWDYEKNYFDFNETKYPKGSSDTLVQWMRKHLCMAALQDIFYTKPSVATKDKENRDIRDPEMVTLGWAQWIETVHNQIHNWIGLDCQDATKAGFDPILYFFHSNIDRQLQAVIDNYGKDLFGWLSMTPQGIPDHLNDLTLLHKPVPFPKELHNLLRLRLGKYDLPTYKNCFQLDWFGYKYYQPYIFPKPEEVQIDPKKMGWITALVEPHHAHQLMGRKSITLRNDPFGDSIGKTHTLGMSMAAGPMRMLHTPVFLDPILIEFNPSHPPPPSSFTLTIKEPGAANRQQPVNPPYSLHWGSVSGKL